ncbi:MAG: ribonuclease E activity regulator RraA [Xanthomonadales bacterium]|jgi:regulator of ribonuclease activity A|nr:ribonuclease E activity regulator RraA [Xanthomonadales bacterium]MDH3923467.1 ribonuclease E activity regulator RraA [Xanthomonadales bacterium]MDH3940670.1 ribonuclease E activity regulator RraA [Xanthomonadales bacterium]MDH4002527.1 ribonuclease E activity regulator RraA [Xanthomonadales bacterium]
MPYSVPDLCDDFMEEVLVLEPLFSDFGGKLQFSGEIVTIKCFEDNSLVRDTVKSEGRGRVLVVDGGGSLRHALLGDLLAASAVENGWQGLLINGCVRDVEILESIDLGVKALNCYPVKTEKRGEGQLNVNVAFAGARIRPGDYLYADRNGILIAARNLGVEF